MNVLNIVARSISSHVLNVDKEIVFKVNASKNCQICSSCLVKACLQSKIEITLNCIKVTATYFLIHFMF